MIDYGKLGQYAVTGIIVFAICWWPGRWLLNKAITREFESYDDDHDDDHHVLGIGA